MIVKPTRSIPRGTDLGRLLKLIEPLIGQKCWDASFVYAGDLSLQFGRRLPARHPKLEGEEGEWILSTCGTAWTLFTASGIVSPSHGSEEQLERKLKPLTTSKVSGIEVGVPDNALTLIFSNKCLLRLVPTSADDVDGVPYWELFMPNNMFVAFGPGARWCYKRSDVPASETDN